MIVAMEDRETFNSRPHKEVDRKNFYEFYAPILSIHDLTRRSTIIKPIVVLRFCLSIHDLTRRSTRQSISSARSVLFQFTTSQGGRLDSDRRALESNRLSIHDLTRRSTRALDIFCTQCTFQFTTSQGGRHRSDSSSRSSTIFQFTTSQGGRRPHLHPARPP